jgi:hypothetical protein
MENSRTYAENGKFQEPRAENGKIQEPLAVCREQKIQERQTKNG